jgi:hypothetical protein
MSAVSSQHTHSTGGPVHTCLEGQRHKGAAHWMHTNTATRAAAACCCRQQQEFKPCATSASMRTIEWPRPRWSQEAAATMCTSPARPTACIYCSPGECQEAAAAHVRQMAEGCCSADTLPAHTATSCLVGSEGACNAGVRHQATTHHCKCTSREDAPCGRSRSSPRAMHAPGCESRQAPYY